MLVYTIKGWTASGMVGTNSATSTVGWTLMDSLKGLTGNKEDVIQSIKQLKILQNCLVFEIKLDESG